MAESSSRSSLIPGLTDDVAELCLSRILRCNLRTISQVCRRWKTFLKSKNFSSVRKLTGPVEKFTCLLMEGQFERDDGRKVKYLFGEVFGDSGNNLGRIPNVPGPFKTQFEVAVLGGGGKIVFIGGYAEVEGITAYASADVYEFDSATNSWRNLAPMNIPRRKFGFAVVDGLLYVIRGFSSNGRNILSSEVYNPETNQWRLLDCPDRPDFRCAFAFSYKSKLYVLGNESGLMEIYDPKTETWQELELGLSLSVYSYTVFDGAVYFFDHNYSDLVGFDPFDNSRGPISVPRSPARYWFRPGEWKNRVILIARFGGRNALVGDFGKTDELMWTETNIIPSGSNATAVVINF